VARLRLEGIEKAYVRGRERIAALRGVTLDVRDGSCVALLGPSGGGKTTLLRIVAGLERPDAGSVHFDERDQRTIPPERRRAGVVFQEDALFPHLSAFANVAYGLRARRVDARVVASRVREVARLARVDDVLARPARALSGGQRQRVALARALAIEPDVLLLDEPLSRLDAPLRAELRVELARLRGLAATTTLLVTHDQGEAMVLGDLVAVIRDGRIEALDTPRALYDRPPNTFIATFVGSPAMALVPAAALGFASGALTTIGLRAEAVSLAPNGDLTGVVRAIEDFGAEAFAYVDGAFGTLVARVSERPRVGANVSLALDFARAHAFDAAGARVAAFVRA
jgi:ABC-type sugar transport system ATPase subunit